MHRRETPDGRVRRSSGDRPAGCRDDKAAARAACARSLSSLSSSALLGQPRWVVMVLVDLGCTGSAYIAVAVVAQVGADTYATARRLPGTARKHCSTSGSRYTVADPSQPEPLQIVRRPGWAAHPAPPRTQSCATSRGLMTTTPRGVATGTLPFRNLLLILNTVVLVRAMKRLRWVLTLARLFPLRGSRHSPPLVTTPTKSPRSPPHVLDAKARAPCADGGSVAASALSAIS